MTNEEIKKIIDLVKENNQKNNAEIVVSLLAIGLKLERLEQLEEENQELKEQRLSLSLQLQDYRLIKEITLPNVLEENKELRGKNFDLSISNVSLRNEIFYLKEKYQKFINFLKLNFDISLDSKLRISDGTECVQTFIIDLPEYTTIDEMFKIIEEVLSDGR